MSWPGIWEKYFNCGCFKSCRKGGGATKEGSSSGLYARKDAGKGAGGNGGDGDSGSDDDDGGGGDSGPSNGMGAMKNDRATPEYVQPPRYTQGRGQADEVRGASRQVHGGQFGFVWLPARTPHGGASYVW